jgi:hypothetical protein
MTPSDAHGMWCIGIHLLGSDFPADCQHGRGWRRCVWRFLCQAWFGISSGYVILYIYIHTVNISILYTHIYIYIYNYIYICIYIINVYYPANTHNFAGCPTELATFLLWFEEVVHSARSPGIESLEPLAVHLHLGCSERVLWSSHSGVGL